MEITANTKYATEFIQKIEKKINVLIYIYVNGPAIVKESIVDGFIQTSSHLNISIHVIIHFLVNLESNAKMITVRNFMLPLPKGHKLFKETHLVLTN